MSPEQELNPSQHLLRPGSAEELAMLQAVRANKAEHATAVHQIKVQQLGALAGENIVVVRAGVAQEIQNQATGEFEAIKYEEAG